MKRLLPFLLWLASLAPAFAYTQVSSTVFRSNGSQSDTQAAISAIPSGGTVEIANGNYTWTSGVTINKPIKLRGQEDQKTTITNQTGNDNWSAAIVSAESSNAGSIDVSGFKIIRGNSVGYHFVATGNGKPTLLHDMVFEGDKQGQCMQWRQNGGVIWNCTFTALKKADAGGIAFKNPGSDSAWKEASFLGAADSNGMHNTYLEDCVFKNMFLQALDLDDNSRTVIRHNVFDNSAITSHGQDTSPTGVRQWEVYENEFIFNLGGNCNSDSQGYPLNMNYFFYVRGGTGTFWNNALPKISSCMWGDKSSVQLTVYNIRRRSSYIPCQTSYPAARQVGYGSDSSGRQIAEPIYIWGNVGSGNYNNPGLVNYNPDECGNNLQVSTFVKSGRDYMPNTPKPGYAPYTYPHPLRGGTPGPEPTPNPTATPTPNPTATPTPNPTATPTPTPPGPTPTPTPAPTPEPTPGGATYNQWLNDEADWIRRNPPTPDK